MAFQTWVTLANSTQQASPGVGKILVNTATATDISPGAGVAGAALTIPGGFLQQGNIIRTTASGWYVNAAASKPTIVWSLTHGGIAAGKVVAETGAAETIEAGAEVPWRWEFITRVKEVEAETGKAKVQTTGIGYGLGKTAQTLAGVSAGTLLVPEKSKTGKETVIEAQKAEVWTLAAKYSAAAGAAQELQVIHWLVEILN